MTGQGHGTSEVFPVVLFFIKTTTFLNYAAIILLMNLSLTAEYTAAYFADNPGRKSAAERARKRTADNV